MQASSPFKWAVHPSSYQIRNVSYKFIRLNFFFYTCSSNSQACTKTCIILRAKQSSSSSPLLQPCLLEFKATSREKKKWNQEKTSEAKQTIRVDSFWNMHFCAYPKKITYTFYAHFSWSTFGLHLMSCPWPSKVILRSRTMEVRPWTWTTDKCHLSWYMV